MGDEYERARRQAELDYTSSHAQWLKRIGSPSSVPEFQERHLNHLINELAADIGHFVSTELARYEHHLLARQTPAVKIELELAKHMEDELAKARATKWAKGLQELSRYFGHVSAPVDQWPAAESMVRQFWAKQRAVEVSINAAPPSRAFSAAAPGRNHMTFSEWLLKLEPSE